MTKQIKYARCFMPVISMEINISTKLNNASFLFHVALNNLHDLSCQALDKMSFNPQIPPLMIPIFQTPFKVQHVALAFG